MAASTGRQRKRRRRSLRLLGSDLAEHLGLSAPLAFASWHDAIDALLALGKDSVAGYPVVIDEFPYLCRSTPGLPSIIQKALSPRGTLKRSSRTRLILCGSALTFMGGLLSGSAPLRGRAGLDLTVPTFDPRTAAAFWGIGDWSLAVSVHTVVGGTPAYGREYVSGDMPRDRADFDDWVVRTVLNPAKPLHKEARYLLAEEGAVREPGLYHSVLAAVAEGNTARGAIAGHIGRPQDTLRHPLTALEDAGFLVREMDALRESRSRYRVTEPLVAFYHAIMRPEWTRLERPGAGAQVWRQSKERFSSLLLGPHFEELCRWWVSAHASGETLGGMPVRVASAVVNDPKRRETHEVDIVAVDVDGRVLALGEAKHGTTMGRKHLERLTRVRALLVANGFDAAGARLLCCSGSGFAGELKAARQEDVVLVGLDRLYTGS